MLQCVVDIFGPMVVVEKADSSDVFQLLLQNPELSRITPLSTSVAALCRGVRFMQVLRVLICMPTFFCTRSMHALSLVVFFTHIF